MALLSAAQAAKLLAELEQRNKPYAASYIRKLCNRKILLGEYVQGAGWIIKEEDLREFSLQHAALLVKDKRFTRFFKGLGKK